MLTLWSSKNCLTTQAVLLRSLLACRFSHLEWIFLQKKEEYSPRFSNKHNDPSCSRCDMKTGAIYTHGTPNKHGTSTAFHDRISPPPIEIFSNSTSHVAPTIRSNPIKLWFLSKCDFWPIYTCPMNVCSSKCKSSSTTFFGHVRLSLSRFYSSSQNHSSDVDSSQHLLLDQFVMKSRRGCQQRSPSRFDEFSDRFGRPFFAVFSHAQHYY